MSRTLLSKCLGVGVVFVQYGCIAHCTLEFVGDFVVCSGPSMRPTIESRNIVLTDHLSVLFGNVRRGDVVIARSPTNPKNFVCKRVTCLPGDPVPASTRTWANRYIPRGHVWLEGDNPDNSTDSRTYGPVPYALLRGRALCKIWPPNDFGSILTRQSTGFKEN